MDAPLEIVYPAEVPKRVTKPTPAQIRAALQWLSAQTASKGGKARWAGISPAERTRLAKAAVAAREAKRRAKRAGR